MTLHTILYRVLKTKIRTKGEIRKNKKKRGFIGIVALVGPSAEPQPLGNWFNASGRIRAKLHSDASRRTRSAPGAFVLRRSLRMIQLKSVFSNFKKKKNLICGIVAWQFLTQKADPFSPSCRSHKAINRGARDSVGFSVASWTMPDATSGLVRLGRLMVGPVIGRVATF